jgi:hypothetical protein
MRTDQLNPALLEPQPHGVAVGGLVVDQSSWLRPRTAWAGSQDGYLLERRLDERDFRRGRRGNPNSQRYAPAIRHHHEPCALSSFGCADINAPFFAGENVPSLNVLAHDRMPSKQRRSSMRWPPPFFEGFCFGMSGSVFDHCSSDSSDTWRLIERFLLISRVRASRCRAQVCM